MRLHALASALLILPLLACSPPPAPQPAAPAATVPVVAVEPDWNGYVDRYIESHLAAHPAQAVTQGRHEFDGVLPDWSRAGIVKEVARLRAVRAEAASFDAAALNDGQRYQRDYLLARTDAMLFWLNTYRAPFRNPAFYFDWMTDSLDPAPYVTLTYAPAAQRLRSVTRYLSNIPAATVHIRDNLGSAPLPPTFIEYGINAFGGLADFYRNELPKAFAEVDDATLLAEFAAAREPAAAAMDGLRDWLTAERANASGDFALGAEQFRQMLLATESVDVDLAELKAAGAADLERNLAALKTACDSYAPGKSLQACVAQMNENKPAAGSVQAARDQIVDLKAFLMQKDLVSIPSDDVALVSESPSYARWNFAYINIPGPFEIGQPAVYFISPPDPTWPAAAQKAYVPGEANLLFTSAHEVWPGHFLNFLHAKKSDFKFGRLFVGYAYAEGWAHYTEEMMWDAGLGEGSPEVHIGQLSNALLRNARFLAAIGLHTEGMTLEQAQTLFIEGGLQDEGTARKQAARGTFDPAYLNYTMGKLMIMQLRDDWTRERGGRAGWKAFHDAFLSYGGPPIPLVRAQMLGGAAETKLWKAAGK